MILFVAGRRLAETELYLLAAKVRIPWINKVFMSYKKSGGLPGGLLRYKRDGGIRRIFLGLKCSTPVFFWVEDLTVYFLGLKNLRVFFYVFFWV